MAFVTSSIYKKAIELAISEGLPKELLHKPFENQVETYVAMDLLLEVYELAEQHLKPGFGIRQGKQLNSNDYGTLGLSWKTSLSATDILNNVKRYMVLVTDDGSVDLIEQNGCTKLTLNRDVYRNGIKIANEATFVMLIGV